LEELRVNVGIDISNNTPFSKFAQEQAIEIALRQGHITFNSLAPKAKFERILKNRELKGAGLPPLDLAGLPFGLPFEENIDRTGGGMV
jgi:hypothetical protein